MWACRAVQKHGLGVRDDHVESSDFSLSVFEGDVSAVHAAIHGHACGVQRGLSDGVVAVRELELQDVADCRDDRVGYEGVLRAAHDDGNDLVLAAVDVWVDGGSADGFVWERGDAGGEEEGEECGLHSERVLEWSCLWWNLWCRKRWEDRSAVM